MRENYCITIDWLQTYCLGHVIQEACYDTSVGRLYVVSEPQETPLFKKVFRVMQGKLCVARILQCPRNEVINKQATLVKLENRVLYSKQYIQYLYTIHSMLNLRYKGITRIDIAYDCNKFKGGRNVAKFIKTFVDKPLGEIGSMYRRGSDRFAAYGSKSSTSDARITSIRFGSQQSRIGAYIYDKSLELREVKDKPWIREMWAENGLIDDEKTHVWRAEISIHAEGCDILNMASGELFKLSPEYLEHYGAVAKLFHIYAGRVFDFRVCDGVKKKRNYKKVDLFEGADTLCLTSKPYYVSKSADTGRMEKICYNKLVRLSETYSDLSEPVRKSLITAMNFLLEVSGKKSSLVRLNNYERYLDELKGCAFIDDMDKLYMAAIENAHIKRCEVSAESLYYACKEVTEILNSEYPDDITKCAYNNMSDIDYLFT